MGADCHPAIHHYEINKTIILIFRDSFDSDLAWLLFYDDHWPYEMKQQRKVQASVTWATFAVDRRSIRNQENTKFVIIGFSDEESNADLVKLSFQDESCP